MRTTGHIFCPLETEASYGHCQILSILDAPLLCSRRSTTAPSEGMDTALRGGPLAACTLNGLEMRKLCVLRFFLVSFVLLYEALSDKVPMSYSNCGRECAHYTSTNRTVAVFTVHTVSIGTVYKESYMKNNINMFNL